MMVNTAADFRAWCKPETQHAYGWKAKPFSQAVHGCKAKLIDDANGMISDWRMNANNEKAGSTTSLPTLLLAVAAVQDPPDPAKMRGVPYWQPVVLPNDPQHRVVQLRAIPKTFKCQWAYVTSNPHDLSSIMDQLCAYFANDTKRRFLVSYHLGGGIVSQWPMLMVENALSPNSEDIQQNLHIATIDLTLIGQVPHVVGLGGDWDNITDNGWNPDDGTVGGGGGGQDEHANDLVIQADVMDKDTGDDVRVHADPDTGVITVEDL